MLMAAAMRIINLPPAYQAKPMRGFSLIELIVFIVIIAIALGALLSVYRQSIINSVDPIKRIRMVELAQARLDQVLSLRYDEATPSGGIPACSSSDIGAVACTNTPDADMDDVDDFNGIVDAPFAGYTRTVQVVTTTLDGAPAKQISVLVAAPGGEILTLAAFKVNF